MGSVFAARVGAESESSAKAGSWVAVKVIPLEVGTNGVTDLSTLHQGLRECLSTFSDLSPKYVVRYDSYWLEEPQGLPPDVLSICERRFGRRLRPPSPMLAAQPAPPHEATLENTSPSGDCTSLRFRERGESCGSLGSERFGDHRGRWQRGGEPPWRHSSELLTPSLAFGGESSLGFIWEAPDDGGNPQDSGSECAAAKAVVAACSPRGEAAAKGASPPRGKQASVAEPDAAPPSFAVLCIEMELMSNPPDQAADAVCAEERLTLRRWLARGERRLSDAADVFGGLIRSLLHIHRKRIVHADLKPDNIFCISERKKVTSVRIADFGLAGENKKDRRFSYGVEQQSIGITGGTPGYVAPEVERADRERDRDFCPSEKVDIFACAVILLELLLSPFKTQMERFEVLNRFRVTAPPGNVPECVGSRLPKTRLLLQEMIEHEPANRLSIEDVCKRFDREIRKELSRAPTQALCEMPVEGEQPPPVSAAGRGGGDGAARGSAGGGGGGGGHKKKGRKAGRRGG